MQTLHRVVLNFNAKCALNCPWCYVPFGSPLPSEPTVKAIIDRLAELRVGAITFGGGDPFQYRFIPSCLRHAKSAGLFVHVDTHAKALLRNDGNLDLLKETVDLLGLPLDGSAPSIHDAVRASPGHFEIVNKCIQWLGPLRQRLKLNTIVTGQNVQDISSLAESVMTLRPARWSIYQFWPLGPAQNAAAAHQLGDDIFEQVASSLGQLLRHSPFVFEATRRAARLNNYPIVHHDGSVIAHHADSQNLVHLGSVFDSDIEEKIKNSFVGERPNAINRYLVVD